jgi:hypothetical protein
MIMLPIPISVAARAAARRCRCGLARDAAVEGRAAGEPHAFHADRRGEHEERR